ncbi:trypsin-like peptidase domain-containing protein [Mucilaginibacter ginkgonis]|uniref:Trypsin-like peptidase domain-containing protein n=1 Tax=Mucilaginibacter ginkgonis TaxID=2682091 RepID=A0A6I4I2Z0_9SPHI|nr:trypsin-like peptidase domain-containing protein [Mucilaginibacter ginkgonis]QQL49606.1 trypsin-like peptidase domain-containing protein [Mucilaginibacter ginkgonis]
MRKVILAVLLLGACRLYAQPVKDLGKYSYLCFAVNNNKTINGTCFFYKSNKNLYLVTNYHVFYGADILNHTRMLNVDTLRISYTSTKTNEQKFFKIANRTDSVQYFNHYDSPDLMAKKIVTVPDDMDVNCINDLVEPSFFKEKPESVVVFGYPALMNKIKAADAVDVQKCYLTGNIGSGDVNSFDQALSTCCDQKNLRKVKRKIDGKEFQMQMTALPGFSGSPVYGKFYKNGTYQYKFIGVMFASDIVNNTSVAINGKTFADYMKTCSME